LTVFASFYLPYSASTLYSFFAIVTTSVTIKKSL